MNHESDAMMEVLKIKEEAWKEVEHLPLEQAIQERLRKSTETAQGLGFKERIPIAVTAANKIPHKV